MRTARTRARREPVIALINIVFLMLVFFLVAGTLAPPLDRDVTLVSTGELPPEAPPDALVVHADGRLTWRGRDIPSAAAYLEEIAFEPGETPRIVPDRALPATALIRLGEEFRAAGAERVMIVTERQLR